MDELEILWISVVFRTQREIPRVQQADKNTASNFLHIEKWNEINFQRICQPENKTLKCELPENFRSKFLIFLELIKVIVK